MASQWTRWGQLALGIVCLVTIANLQYAVFVVAAALNIVAGLLAFVVLKPLRGLPMRARQIRAPDNSSSQK